jgi:hypothetical protein
VHRRYTICTIAIGFLFTSSGCGGRLFHRRCQDSVSPRTAPEPRRDLDSPRGVIPPRETETIPSPSLPTTPGAIPRVFDPISNEPGRTTYSTPRLQDPVGPFLPPVSVPSSPDNLPSIESLPPPTEVRKFIESENQPKKLYLTPADDTSESGRLRPSTDRFAQPDRRVLLDPVNANIPNDPPVSLSPGPLPVPNLPVPHTANSSPAVDRPEVQSIGLPDMTRVIGEENIASGRKPSLDGLNWLQKAGYRTVVYIHDPKMNPEPAAELCRTRGMKFVGIPASTGKLPEMVKAFELALADAANRPVYVCDDNGLWAGTIWYTHFRTASLMNPDAAKVRANSLGLADPDTNAEQKKLWDAAQEYLRTK